MLKFFPLTNARPISLRELFLSIAVLWGVSVTVVTEALSGFSWLTFGPIAAFWSLALLVSIGIVVSAAQNRSPVSPPLGARATLLLAGLAIIVALTGVTALLAPPNSYDSMAYHMSRVMHWVQNRNVAFYPTHILTQLVLNPWAEFAIMHLQILSGGDRFANFVQWFSMIGSLVGASLLAKELGGNRLSQLFAAVFAATIPMGVLQSSSTQNDYAASFWLVCFVYFSIALMRREQIHWRYVWAAGLSLGLAVLTKGTAYIFAAPFAVWIGCALARKFRAQSWKPALVAGAACLALNAGHYARNLDLFGFPIGPVAKDSLGKLTNDVVRPATIVSNLARNVALHLGTPSRRVNAAIDRAIRELHRLLNLDVEDSATTWPAKLSDIEISDPQIPWPATIFEIAPSRHEGKAGNPLHLFLLLAAILLFLFRAPKKAETSRFLPGYLAALASGFLLFCVLLKWQPWNSRLHLPLFVLAAPFVAAVLCARLSERLVFAIALVLLLSAAPWLFFNASRPLLGNHSVWRQTRVQQYFINRPALREAYLEAARLIKTQNCRRIGLVMTTFDWEYPLWPLLKAETDDMIRIEHVHVANASGALAASRLKGFAPCAIVSSRRAGNFEKLTDENGVYTKVWASNALDLFVNRP
jgi:hypothetical protein